MLRVGRPGLMVDFDGTISRIAPKPAEAVVSRGIAESLGRLAPRLALVCVISGRAVSDLKEKVGLEGLMYVGNHGVEYLNAGWLSVVPGAAEYRDKIRRVLGHLKSTADRPGLIWKDKLYSASVHYRLAKDPAQARRALAASLDSAPGAKELDVFWGKMVLEIRAPGGYDKGYALHRLVREFRLDSAILLGDDTTDVDALTALRELRARGDLKGAGVAVLQEDSPEELVRFADYGLDGVAEVEAFFEWLDAAAS